MFQKIALFCLLAGAAVSASATTITSQGTFNADDDVLLIPFTITAADIVTIQSYGYAGGTAPDGTVIAEGGFAPNALLFDQAGNEISSNNGGNCAITGADSVTGNCDDPWLQASLSAGTYTLALVEWDNTTSDGFLPDGFVQTGNPGFTCAEFGASGNFCDVTTALGTQRNGHYGISVTAADLVMPTPEPSTFVLVSCAVAIAGILRRRAVRQIDRETTF